MDLITTHMNADFDALGSMVAAKKLYPKSRLLLPGSPEEAVREFLFLAKEIIMVESERECKLDDIDRLVLVDTRHASRIGIASQLIGKGVEIHIYDHHPRIKSDIIADKEVYEEVGATVTILADIIKKRKIKLSYVEATIMLIGIYEETGSLTFRTTTKLDVDMVSFLLSQGANLPVVSSYLNRELSRNELTLLTKLINSTERVTIKGLSISFIEMDSENYVSELSALIHKLLEIENIPVLFVLIRMPNHRVDIIARSNIQAVDVNRVLSHFGGGGHPTAASSKVRNTDPCALKEKLINILRTYIKVRVRAKDIMSKTVKAIDVNEKIDSARKALVDAGFGGIPVVDKGRVVGIINLDGLNKAIKRGFSHSRIKGYMSPNIVIVRPDTPLHEIQRVIMDKNVGVLPVVKGGRVMGVIHRTDVLRNVHDGLFLKMQPINKKVLRNLAKKMTSLLPSEIVRLLKRIGKIANSSGCTSFVVGGLVRDLLLGVKNLDLDIVVEGDAIKLGQILAKELKASLVVHKRFGTCSIVTAKRLKIDIATARKEVYEKPAALPTVVEFSSLKDDLIRRDFTINAMAVSLNKSSFGQLVDFFGGEHDLAMGRIKVMHDASFIDDPTRIFRAVRFEQRFGFAIDNHTEGLILNAIKEEMFDKVEPQRIRDELLLILTEKEPLRALRRMSRLDELRFLHSKIRLDQNLIHLYHRVDEACMRYDSSLFKKRPIDKWLMYLMVLVEYLSYREVSHLCERLVLRRGDKGRLLSYKRNAGRIAKVLNVKKFIEPSRIYRLLEPLSFEVILMIMAKADSRKAFSRINDFFEKYNGIKTRICGNDIEAMGLKPCPSFKVILKKVLYGKIDGKLKTRKEELRYAGTLVKGLCI